MWIRLPQLPTEFYDLTILQKIGNTIGRQLRIDACTSSTLRGRYAQLCVEVPMDKPVKLFVYIGNYKQHIYYEGEKFLCIKYGKLDHNQLKCLVLSPHHKANDIQGGITGPQQQDSSRLGNCHIQ